MQQKPWVIAFCTIVLLAGNVFAEQVENPVYRSWAEQKVGTSTTIVMKALVGGQARDINTTSTLKALTDDGADVENAVSFTINGQAMNAPPQKAHIAKMMEKDSKDPGQLDAAKVEKAAEESVTVKAGTFKAKVIPINGETKGMKMTGKAW